MNDLRNELAPFNKRDSSDPLVQYFIYRGPSMVPTFKPGQILHVKPHASDMSQGDIIVFHVQNDEYYKVHRIIMVSSNGYITRGDNNLHNDLKPITRGQIIGRVEHTESGRLIRPVLGGWRGRRRACLLRARLLIKRNLRKGLNRPCQWLKCSGIIAKLWQTEISAIHFTTPDGPLVKYIHKGTTVASCWTATNHWWFKRPYDFIIGPKPQKKRSR